MNIKYMGWVYLFFFSASALSDAPRKKPWTFLVYMAADNDLYLFADRNIEQLKRIGSNELVNILVHLDIRKPNTQKVTKRLCIQKNKVVQCGPDRCMDSGNHETLLDALLWAHQEYPSECLAIDFWNHGSGDLNPVINRSINPSQFFYFNPTTRMIELDRSIGFLDYLDMLNQSNQNQRGVCFDDSMGTYLDDAKLQKALSEFCAQRGKKIDVIMFDACLMAGVGTAWVMQPFGSYMVASEEVALGPGYDYSLVLSGLAYSTPAPRAFAEHVVACYEKIYGKITQDYTQSAIDLEKYPKLAQNVSEVGDLLIQGLRLQYNNSFRYAIRQSMLCVAFNEPSYRDLGSFYLKLLNNIKQAQFVDATEGKKLIAELEQAIHEGIALIKDVVFANATGLRVKEAMGIYTYLPSKRIHQSYPATEFAKNSRWKNFLEALLS